MQHRARPRVGRSARLAATLVILGVAAALAFGTAAADDGNESLSEAALLFGRFPEPATTPGSAPAVLDAGNPAATLLQPPADELNALPHDSHGRPDWMRALREGTIKPRADLRGEQKMQTLDLDILMKNTAQMPYVRFPHQAHTEWLACANCHDSLFVARAGANPTSMARILKGQSCGTCHTAVAFSAMFTCERCHSVPQPGQARWW